MSRGNSVDPLYRAFIGFENMIDHLSRFESMSIDNYPPYNIIKASDTLYKIEIAAAGFKQKDISVTVEGDKLTIRAGNESRDEVEGSRYIHRGLGFRSFTRRFTLNEDINVTKATMEDGILTIELERIVPERVAARTIPIQTTQLLAE